MLDTQTSTRAALTLALHDFMDKLRIDIKEYLDKDVPFICKVDVHLGTQESHREQITAYGKILSDIMKTVPSEYFPEEGKQK